LDLLKSKQLRQQRAKLIADARAITKKDVVTPEELRSADAMMDDADALMEQVKVHERTETAERELSVANGTERNQENTEEQRGNKKLAIIATPEYRKAFVNYLFNPDNLTPEDRSILRNGYVEERALSASTGSAGAYSIPQGFMAEVEKAEKFFGGAAKYARIINTASGNAIPWPTVDDTSNSGEDKAENTAGADQDVTFGSATLNAYKMDSGVVKVPNELFEDAGVNLEELLGEILGERIGRRKNTKQTTGSGSSTFQGFVIGASLGVTAASATAIAADELFDLFHSVDPAYRQNPKVCWQMNDAVIKAVRKLKDSQGRYLWEASIQAGVPDQLMNKPVVANNDMDTIATTKKTIVFGDFSKFVVRNVRNLVIRRLSERYAEADQTAFIAWYRGDSRVVSASTKALTYLQQA
jgi:HK97 family phage major capsid protein